MQALQDDYLAVEGYLVEQLSSIDGIRKVYRSCDLAEMKETAQTTPALHVIYNGDQVTNTAQGGALAHVKQAWLVVLTVDLRRHRDTGALLARVIKAMSGLHCELGTLVRVNAPRPGFSQGFGYYPLAFEITFRIQPKR